MDKSVKIVIAVLVFLLLTKYVLLGLVGFYIFNYFEVNKNVPESQEKPQIALDNSIQKLKDFFLN